MKFVVRGERCYSKPVLLFLTHAITTYQATYISSAHTNTDACVIIHPSTESVDAIDFFKPDLLCFPPMSSINSAEYVVLAIFLQTPWQKELHSFHLAVPWHKYTVTIYKHMFFVIGNNIEDTENGCCKLFQLS